MDDLTQYIEDRTSRDPEFAEGLDSGYQKFKARVLRRQAAAESSRQSGLGKQDRTGVTSHLADTDAERSWDELFANSAKQLAKLADEALREHELGKTKELDPERR